jgi:hypothetical protein
MGARPGPAARHAAAPPAKAAALLLLLLLGAAAAAAARPLRAPRRGAAAGDDAAAGGRRLTADIKGGVADDVLVGTVEGDVISGLEGERPAAPRRAARHSNPCAAKARWTDGRACAARGSRARPARRAGFGQGGIARGW